MAVEHFAVAYAAETQVLVELATVFVVVVVVAAQANIGLA